MFNISTLPKFYIEENQINDFKISKSHNNTFILTHKNKQLMTYGLWHNIQAKEFYACYDLAHGTVIMSGLGFGILPIWIASKPGVDKVIVYEVSQEIIHMFLKANYCPQNMQIICADINQIKFNDKFDCLFLDHYEKEDSLIKLTNMMQISENMPNHDIFWAWSLEHEYVKLMYRISDAFMLNHNLSLNIIDFSTKWEEFINNIVPISTIPKLTKNKINEYVYTYFDKIGYTIPNSIDKL